MSLSPIVWVGGKQRLAKKLVALLPPFHFVYCEVFGGGAALLFAKRPADLEIYNDIDSLLVNFFRVLRDENKYKKLIELLELTPYSREEYLTMQQKLKNSEDLDDVTKAYYFWYVASSCFSGKMHQGWKHSKKPSLNPAKTYYNKLKHFQEWHERIRNVQIENLHWKDFLKTYSGYGDEGIFYLDPPYYPDSCSEKRLYRFEMTKEEHEELIQWLLEHETQDRFMLSGFENELYGKALKHWRKVCFDVKTSVHYGKGKSVKKCVWMNYDVYGLLLTE